MTDKPAWPKEKTTKECDCIMGEDCECSIFTCGFNHALSQCEACVEGIAEDELLQVIAEHHSGNLEEGEKLAAAIAKHIKSRLTAKERE